MARNLIVLLFMVSGTGASFGQAPDTMAVHFYLTDTFCTNQTLLINNHFYGPDNPLGTEIIPGGAASGADSIIHVQLTFLSPPVYFLTGTICAGDTVWVNGDPYHAQHWLGQETLEDAAFNGCDSLVKINLSVVYPSTTQLRDTLCSGEQLLVNGQAYDELHPLGEETIPGGASNGCDSIINISLSYFPASLDLGPDAEIVLGDTICLIPELDFDPVSWIWSPAPPCPDCLEGGCAQPAASISYSLRLTDVFGCTVSDDLYIKVRDERLVYAPNVMNPDGSYPNNYFFIGAGAQVTRIKQLFIADRWGSLIFEQKNTTPNDPSQGWNGMVKGQKALSGVYMWWAEIEFLDGKTIRQEGTLTVVR